MNVSIPQISNTKKVLNTCGILFIYMVKSQLSCKSQHIHLDTFSQTLKKLKVKKFTLKIRNIFLKRCQYKRSKFSNTCTSFETIIL